MSRDVSRIAERADRVSRSLERDAGGMLSVFLRDPDTYVQRVLEWDDDEVPEGQFADRLASLISDDEWHYLQTIAATIDATPGEDSIHLARWARHRIVYAVDPDTAAAVADTDWADVVIPGEILRRLPHPDPMVILPEPVSLPSYDGDGNLVAYEEYEAFMVCGSRPPRYRASTAYPGCNRFILHFLGRVVDPVTRKPEIMQVPGRDGGVRNVAQVVGMRALVDLGDATMAEREEYAIRDVLDRGWANKVGFADDDDAARATAALTRLGLTLLVYLVTDDLDARTTRVTPRRRKGNRRASATGTTGAETTTVVEVGYRVGAALRNAAAGHGAGHGDGKRTVRPHVRRAHLHKFWKGPRNEPDQRFQILRWIPPVAVAWRDGDKPTDVTQVHLP